MEGIALDDLVIGTFSGFANFAGTVHPAPEVFGGSNYVVRDVVQDIVELGIGWIGGEEGVLIVGFDLEEGVAFSVGGDWLAD